MGRKSLLTPLHFWVIEVWKVASSGTSKSQFWQKQFSSYFVLYATPLLTHAISPKSRITKCSIFPQCLSRLINCLFTRPAPLVPNSNDRYIDMWSDIGDNGYFTPYLDVIRLSYQILAKFSSSWGSNDKQIWYPFFRAIIT